MAIEQENLKLIIRSAVRELLQDDDELLTKKELCERILRCDIKTAEMHIINEPNFPYIWVGDKKRYPKKQVEEWIANNTHKT